MNSYPVWWDKTLTLYNKYEDDKGQITWYKTVLEDCFWKYTGNHVRVNDSVIATNDTICRIPKSDDYLDYYEWEQLTDKSSYFTIGRGDIIVCGEVADDINEYESGHRSTDLLNKYRAQGCIEVVEFAINVGKGRVNEHYFVKGV